MNNTHERPSYYALIPAKVRYDQELKPNEKLLYGEITALCNKHGYCCATNDYFSSLYKVTKKSISVWINNLIAKKYIYSQIIYKDNSKIIDKRILKLEKNIEIDVQKINEETDNDLWKKSSIGYGRNLPEGMEEKVKDNNTSINNKKNISKDILKKIYFEDPKVNSKFIDFLQEREILKAKNSERAINSLVNKLNNYPDNIKYEMIDKSIRCSWKDIFPLKGNSQTTQKEGDSEWI